MNILFYGSLILFCAFLVHLIVWRIRTPKNQTRALFLIFLAILTIGILVLRFASNSLSRVEYLHIILYYISLALAYLITYSAIEVDSPSMIIIQSLDKAGEKGLTKIQLERIMSDDLLIKPRIQDLVNSRMVYLAKDKFKLSLTGFLFISLFVVFRKLLKEDIGG